MKEGLEKDTKKVDNSSGVKDGDVSSSPEVGKKKGKEEKPPTKVVVRRLPPSMTEVEFLQQVDPLPPIDYMYFVPSDNSLALNSFSRAYLNFINQSDIFIFTQKFDGYVFVDSKGMEYPAVVEFAPFQRIPKQRPGRKKDPKAGTLESDDIYKAFLEKLQAESQENKSSGLNMKQHFFETSVSSNEDGKLKKVCTTPLLDYIRTRHADRARAREEKRKKDVERRRAKEELRRNAAAAAAAKKAAAANQEEESPASSSPVVKVLLSQTTNKERTKDKDSGKKDIKRRSDDRLKENKNRVGRSYQEERQRQQAEKREEQRKKYSNATTINHKGRTLSHEGSGKDQKQHPGSDSLKKDQDCSDGKRVNDSGGYEKKNVAYRKHYESSSSSGRRAREERASRKKEKDEAYAAKRKERTTEKKGGGGGGGYGYKDRHKEKLERKETETEEVDKKDKVSKGVEQPPKECVIVKDAIEAEKEVRRTGTSEDPSKKTEECTTTTTATTTSTTCDVITFSGDAQERLCQGEDETRQRRKSYSGPLNKIDEIGAGGDAANRSRSAEAVRSPITECADDDEDDDARRNGSGEVVVKRRNSLENYGSRRKKKEESEGIGRSNSLEEEEKRSNSSEEAEGSTSETNSNSKQKDPRTERRIRNKDRPSIEIYRPGMGRFSKKRLEREGKVREGDDGGGGGYSSTTSPSPSPTLLPNKTCTAAPKT